MTVPADRTPEELAAEYAALELRAEALAAPESTSTALVPTAEAAPAVKARMAEKRRQIVALRTEMKTVTDELERKLAIETRKIEDQLATMREKIAPLRKMAERLEEGIWTVNLYLGRDEDILTLAEGPPAPAETPITVRQMVLSMDEESRINAEDGGIDARQISEFDRWIMADPAHLEQVLPEQRGVVVLVPRVNEKDRDYGDPFTAMNMHEANQESYWLIRNGGMVYSMTTNFKVGSRLIPAHDEFTSYFTRIEGHGRDRRRVPIEPGTREWLDAEEAAGDRQRHFMRSALILQGLIDRTAVFHPLPAPTVSLLQPESYDAGHVVVISDADMVVSDGHESFPDWCSRLRSQLAPGMRIIGSFHGSGWGFGGRDDERSRTYPKYAPAPAKHTIHTLDGRKSDGGLTFKYERSDKRYGYEFPDAPSWRQGRYGEWPYQQRASATVYQSDRFILPFDLVTVAEMEYYLNSRTERKHYVDMIPLLTAALAAKRAEAEQEAPFRQLLVGALMKAGADVEDAETTIPDLVQRWKLANRWHRPLIGTDAEQAKAIRMIVADFQRQLADRPDETLEQKAVAAFLEHDPATMAVFRKADGTFVAYAPETPRRNVYARSYAAGVRLKIADGSRWKQVPLAYKRWRLIHSTDTWDRWDFHALRADWLTDPEIDTATAEIVKRYRRRGLVAVSYDERSRTFLAHRPGKTVGRPDPILTGDLGTWESRTHHIDWKRTADGVELTFADDWDERRDMSRAGSWDRSGAPPWENGHGWSDRTDTKIAAPGVIQTWLDEDRIAAMLRERDEVAAFKAERSAVRSRAEAILSRLTDAWDARALQQSYERFVEDYGDATLWDDHKKAVKLPDFPWAEKRHRNGFWNEKALGDPVERVAYRLAETDSFPESDLWADWIEAFRALGDKDAEAYIAEMPETIAELTLAPAPKTTADDLEWDADDEY